MPADAPSMSLATLAMRNLPRSAVLGLIGFLTLVDLFAAQAILPSLVDLYGVSRAAMRVAVVKTS